MSWMILRSISCRSTLHKTPVKRVFDLPQFHHKRAFSGTPKVFAKSDLIPDVHNYINELNACKRSERQPIYDRLSKVIAENILEPELAALFTEIIQKEGKSPVLDIIAKTNPERTASLLCQLDPELLSKVSFDITFSELCNIVEKVIIQKPVNLIPTLSTEEQDRQDYNHIVPYDKKPITWEYSFVNFTATHVLDELLPEELGNQVFLWVSRRLYPIALKQAKKDGKIFEIMNFNLSGFMTQLLGMIIAKGSALNNWNDTVTSDYAIIFGGHIINMDSNISSEEKLQFWAHLIASIAHLEHVVRQKNTAYDIRLLHTLAREISKTWSYSEKLNIVDRATKLVERKGSLLSFLDYVRNMM